jgi:hypothetical protein
MIDAKWSWCECADRFALAVLIAEMLLIDQDTPLIQEDGTLFSQAQIDEAGCNAVTEKIGRLEKMSQPVGTLLRRTFMSRQSHDCPAPGAWIAALKTAERRQENTIRTTDKHSRNKSTPVMCGRCEKTFRMSIKKRDGLLEQNKAPLCKTCFNAVQDHWASQRLLLNMERPNVRCEHCEEQVRISRRKLDSLRGQGKPILCSDCLRKQLETWKKEQAEHDHSRPRVTCTLCKETYRMNRPKMEGFQLKGKPLLCQECLKAKRQPETQSKAVTPPKTSYTKSIFKHLTERIQKWA